ncbi:hypothetical protein EW026_g4670 [Hermanssonia centrifuga]|uniref:Uncharacterized protein n=1 Tax=Hermanssonia centrifuga TaxID=98765 RepID=A0A4S4KI57_9APHY|nr:hypothetical protein EW026_g4670 [Hermanssonia centrifuga]
MDDPAASLRAAALLTLKSNRRKANTGNEVPVGLLPRPVSTAASIQLDYGTEEPSFGASSTASSTTTSAAIPRPAPAPEPMEVDEVREEGEISDSESTPGHKSPPQQPASPRATPPNPRSRHQPLPPKLSLNESSAASSAIKLPTTAPIAVKTEPAPAALDQSVGPTSATISAASHRSVSYPNEAMLVDEEHVRPGLSMTQAQYNTAKDIVLDLLGWGVPPEYLVSCGLSREIVYYVFIELNLRLPNNLDVTGLPESTAVFGVGHATTPPRPVHAHPSLPRKPPAPRRTSANAPAEGPASQLSATAPLFVPSASTSIPISGEQPSLFDMEQQRRQELLARKAVLASRKLKNAAAASSSYAPTNEAKDVDMAPPIVPTKTVEDFLNSIPAVSTDSKSPGGDDDMDVDAIPGLSANRESPQSNASTPRSTSVSDIITTSEIVPPPRALFSATFTSGDLEFS